ncbi:MAG: GNAT family N-acetyltransferase [Rhizobiaceae bacterium]
MEISLVPEWNYKSEEFAELFANASATAFQHPLWLDAMHRLLATPLGAKSQAITIRETVSNELIAVLPLMRIKRRGVSLLEFADLGVTDYCAPVVRNGRSGVLHDCDDLPSRISKIVGPHDIFRAKSVRPEHVKSVECIIGAAPAPAGFSAHEASLETPYADWRLRAFGKSQTRYIDRRLRRFERLGDTNIECLDAAADIRRAIGELRIFRTGRFDADPIQQDCVHEFYAEVAVRGAASGFARTYRLSHDGVTVGIVFGTAHKGRFNYLLIGCDYDNYAKHSPGLLMYDMIMSDWVSDGGNIFDFTIGDEAFKADFGTKPVQMSSFQRAASLTGKVAGSIHAVTRRLAG